MRSRLSLAYPPRCPIRIIRTPQIHSVSLRFVVAAYLLALYCLIRPRGGPLLDGVRKVAGITLAWSWIGASARHSGQTHRVSDGSATVTRASPASKVSAEAIRPRHRRRHDFQPHQSRKS